ncbi:MAG TPA: ArsR family transcriptional regulator [Anaerolineales bacterium]|nr:ArsR family transcriptional regulator [Anaerolineales bacterium]
MSGDSRARILEFLKRHRSGSVADLSRGLGLTPVTIRHHLEALMADDLVEEPSPRRRPGPGRPEMAYRLTPSADSHLPRNYGELCACLVRELDGGLGSSVGNALEAAGTALGHSLVENWKQGHGDRRKAALAVLERRGYLPAWEDVEGIPTLVLCNCPYLEVARAAPGMCQFDMGLIESVLGSHVHLEASIAAADPACRVRLTEAPL